MKKSPHVPFVRTPRRFPSPARDMVAKHRPGVAQPKAVGAPMHKPMPIAPKVYRPQPVPKVLQTKMAAAPPVNQPKGGPAAPPVYRPQPIPKVLQKKTVAGARPQPNAQVKTKSIGAPVHNPHPARKMPQPNKVVQPKPAARVPMVIVSKTAVGHNKTVRAGVIQRKEFQYNDRTYHGIDPEDCRAWITPQQSLRTCWAAVLSNAQGMLGRPPAEEEEMIGLANRTLGQGTQDDATYMIRNGAQPSHYQEIINMMKERTGIRAHSVPWSAANFEQIFAHVVGEKPVIIGNEADDPHVVTLLAVHRAASGEVDGVLCYDTDGGAFREASLATFQSNRLKTAFLMDRYGV